MAIFHLNAKIIGRGQGRSAVAAAAYRAGVIIYSKYQDIEFNYSKKRDVAFSEIIKPEYAPEWMNDREALWNAVELFEKRKDASYAREIEGALPIELSTEQQKELVRDFVKNSFVESGMVVDYSIHGANSPNPHAHIMLTMRVIVNGGFGRKVREWNDRKLLVKWREEWAVHTNKHLAMNGIDKAVSHLSHADRGINLEPTIHRGFMSQRNQEVLDRYQAAKDIKERNYSRLIAAPSIALEVLTHHESVFTHHDIARFVNERTSNLEEFNTLKNAIESCDEIVKLGQGLDGKDYYTSQKVLVQEQDLILRATQLANATTHSLLPKQFEFVLASRTLTEEQQAAFNFILSGKDLSLIVGFAGTGKSYLMDAVREAYEAAGYNVVGTALAGKAVDGLAKSANINSQTIARFLIDWENGRRQLTNKTVLVIDEVGMVGTRQMLALMQEADRVGAKVICCGDPEQIPPVEAGCPFRFLLERINHIFLKNVIRQKKEWQRQATIELSTRQHGKAIDKYHEYGHVHEHANNQAAMESIVSDWYQYTTNNPNKTAIMMSYRNIDVLAMNLMAREKLLAENQLSQEKTIVETDVYGKLEFSHGDRVMFLRNENSLNVKNGFLGTIETIADNNLTIKLDHGDTVSFDTRDYKDLGYGYASTIHKMQGATVDQSYFLATKHCDRFLANVALDRHRDDVELHYSKKEFASFDNLKRTLSRGDSKVLAVEFAQARGIDYEIQLDQAAAIESQKDFINYYDEILQNSVSIKGTLAETYLENLGLKDIDVNNVRFNSAVWERETQSYMPALVARAVGEGRDGLQTKGVQVTFLNNEGKKAPLEQPIRYSGSPDAIIMLQKPTKKDERWFLAADIETGLAICKANSSIRVACIATQENFEKNPLRAVGNKPLMFCANKNTERNVRDRAIDVFSKKGFEVSVCSLENEIKFNETEVEQEFEL